MARPCRRRRARCGRSRTDRRARRSAATARRPARGATTSRKRLGPSPADRRRYSTSVTPSAGSSRSAQRSASPVPRGGSCSAQVRSGSAKCRAHRVAVATVNDADRARRQSLRRVDDVREQRPSGQRVQHLGQRRVHALAVAGGENRDLQGRSPSGRELSHFSLGSPPHPSRVVYRSRSAHGHAVLYAKMPAEADAPRPKMRGRSYGGIMLKPFVAGVLAGVLLTMLAAGAFAADACKNRGELDAMYCDDNNDMVADAPADSEEVEEPVDDRVHLHAGRGSRGLREHIQAVHHASGEMPRQEGRVLPGAIQRRRDRGDALGPPARRAASRPVRPRSRSTSPARCRSRSRATPRNSRATT